MLRAPRFFLLLLQFQFVCSSWETRSKDFQQHRVFFIKKNYENAFFGARFFQLLFIIDMQKKRSETESWREKKKYWQKTPNLICFTCSRVVSTSTPLRTDGVISAWTDGQLIHFSFHYLLILRRVFFFIRSLTCNVLNARAGTRWFEMKESGRRCIHFLQYSLSRIPIQIEMYTIIIYLILFMLTLLVLQFHCLFF